uniref:Uncharacterized protein n=1 Tax=Odontella aurita TaxID=265563 RepID=A0A7S4IZT4_9STRA
MAMATEEDLPPSRVGFAPCSPLLAFGSFVLVATSDGRVCAYEVKRFDEAVNEDLDRYARKSHGGGGGGEDSEGEEAEEDDDWEEVLRVRRRMRRAAEVMDAVPPFATVGPLRVGGSAPLSRDRIQGKGDEGGAARIIDDSAFVVAVCAAPAGVSLVRYRYNRKRRPQGGKNKGDILLPPIADPKPGFLGHAVVLTSEGDVHLLEFTEESGYSAKELLAPPNMKLAATWSTGEVGATCMCIRGVHTNAGEAPSPKSEYGEISLRLCIGHESGALIEYELVSVVTALESNIAPSRGADDTTIRKTTDPAATPLRATKCPAEAAPAALARTPSEQTSPRRRRPSGLVTPEAANNGNGSGVTKKSGIASPTTAPLKDGSKASSKKTSRSPSFDALDKIAAMVVERRALAENRNDDVDSSSSSSSSSSNLFEKREEGSSTVGGLVTGEALAVSDALTTRPNQTPVDVPNPGSSSREQRAQPSTPRKTDQDMSDVEDLSKAPTPRRAGSSAAKQKENARSQSASSSPEAANAQSSSGTATDETVSTGLQTDGCTGDIGTHVSPSADGAPPPQQLPSSSSGAGEVSLVDVAKTHGESTGVGAPPSPNRNLASAASSAARSPARQASSASPTTPMVSTSNDAIRGPPSPPPPPPPRPTLRYSDPRPRLLWRGSFDCPIRSLSALGDCGAAAAVGESRGERVWSASDVDSGSDGEVKEEAGGPGVSSVDPARAAVGARKWWQPHLAVGLEQRIGGGGGDGSEGTSSAAPFSPSASSTLEVINAARAEREWVDLVDNVAISEGNSEPPFSKSRTGKDAAVPLEGHCVWPGAGMEVRQAWKWSGDEVGSECGDIDCDVVSTGQLCCFGRGRETNDDPAFVAAMSDGTLVALHSFARDDNSMEWGVSHDLNQTVLLGRNLCAGVAAVDCSAVCGCRNKCDESSAMRFIVSCARDGTVYFAPVIARTRRGELLQKSAKVAVFKCPMDRHGNDDSVVVRYLQGFAAGCVKISRWCEEFTDTHLSCVPGEVIVEPVFLHAWAGGLLDVYACSPSCSCSRTCGHDGNEDTTCGCGLDSIVSRSNGRPSLIFDMLVKNGTARELVHLLISLSEDCERLQEKIWHQAWEECKKCQNAEDLVNGIETNEEKFRCLRALLLYLSIAP